MANSEYKKLSGGSLMSVQVSYLGEDHLLLVDGRFQETVKRLKYDDIEALLICPTKSGMIFALIGALFGFVFLILGFANLGEGTWLIWWMIAAFCWSVFAYGLIGKGSAVMGVQTAVQTVIFEGVTTLRKARRVEAKLSAKIEAVQGALSAEALRGALARERKAHYTTEATPPPLRSTEAAIPVVEGSAE